ncbi:MAG: hypothetical protein H0T91_08245 [Propionibacteriaceae bacterium]|nr:hypothetical protein [Propionibacteriaceae bacterium]
MNTTIKTSRRASLPLSERDQADLATLRRSITHRIALGRITHRTVTDDLSEAAFLHALVEAGIKAVEQEVEEAGYAELAADREDRDEARSISAARRQRRPDWADEA